MSVCSSDKQGDRFFSCLLTLLQSLVSVTVRVWTRKQDHHDYYQIRNIFNFSNCGRSSGSSLNKPHSTHQSGFPIFWDFFSPHDWFINSYMSQLKYHLLSKNCMAIQSNEVSSITWYPFTTLYFYSQVSSLHGGFSDQMTKWILFFIKCKALHNLVYAPSQYFNSCEPDPMCCVPVTRVITVLRSTKLLSSCCSLCMEDHYSPHRY